MCIPISKKGKKFTETHRFWNRDPEFPKKVQLLLEDQIQHSDPQAKMDGYSNELTDTWIFPYLQSKDQDTQDVERILLT